MYFFLRKQINVFRIIILYEMNNYNNENNDITKENIKH